MRLDTPIETADLAWAFASLCSLLRVPFDPDLFLQQFPPPLNVASLSHAASSLGLQVNRRRYAPRDLPQIASPLIALRRAAHGGASRVALILDADAQAVLVAERNMPPSCIRHTELAANYERDMLVVVPRDSASSPEDDRRGERER
ncbi:MAG TPA: hypothetical protein VN929_09905 [Burkholderiales bacterium]|nr:hypothetical protein [Burkholderiales bacterium]